MPLSQTERCKRWRDKNPEYFKTEKFKRAKLNDSLKYKYGITLEEKEKLFHKQHGLCPICFLALPSFLSGNCCVDHDHETLRVRGLVHKACNLWIGFVEKHGQVVFDRIKNYL
jgi:Recombination endonuclease VII